MSFAIKSLTNPKDNVHLAAILDGAPVGALSFWASRIPEMSPSRYLPLHFDAPTNAGDPYLLQMPAPGGWYVWGRDDDGFTRQPGAAFAGYSDDALTQEAGIYWRDTLTGHKPLLEAALAAHYPPGESPGIKQIVFGLAALVEEYPAIVIADPEKREPYVGTDTLRQVTVSLGITCMYVHKDRQTHMLPAMSTLADRLQGIINLFDYNQIELPSKIRLANCQAITMTATETGLGQIGWGAEATLQWSGETTRRQAL